MSLKNNRSKTIIAAVIAGAVAFSFVAPALAQVSLVPMCFRNRNIQVPSYLVTTYQLQGAQPGTCQVSP